MVPFRRRFNYGKANWEMFASSIDDALLTIPPTTRNYDKFVNIILKKSRKYIPRGCSSSYIPGLSPVSIELLERYEDMYNSDPFSVDTIEIGEQLLQEISESRRGRWIDTVTNIDMTHNSKKAWATI